MACTGSAGFWADLFLPTWFCGQRHCCLKGPISLPTQTITWIAILWLAIMATGIGTFFYYSLINAVGATKTSLTTYVFPLVGVLLGVLFFKEAAAAGGYLAGGILVIAGVAIVNSQITLASKAGESRPTMSEEQPRISVPAMLLWWAAKCRQVHPDE